MLALQFQFMQSERWPPEQRLARQFEQLGALLEHVWQYVPFYRERLQQAGYQPGMPVDKTLWRRIPIVTRAELQTAGRALVATQVPQAHGKLNSGRTSGSTGAPLQYVKTELSGMIWRAMTLRDHLWHGRDFSKKLAVIRAKAERRVDRGWGPAVDCVFDSGLAASLGVDVTIDEQLDWLIEQQPAYLLTYPNVLRELVLASQKRGLRIASLLQLRTFAEPLPEETRALCREHWGVGIADMYSSQEVGYMALQCPEREHYHVQSENVLLEVLDSAGEPCRPGDIGRVVVTPLHNYAMPFLRYAIGDHAEVSEPCSCGRTLPVLKRIVGRDRNMLILPDGQRRWPLFGVMSYADIDLIRQFQVIQKDLKTLQVRLVTREPWSSAHETGLRLHLLSKLDHPFDLELVYLDEIPRSASGKFEDFKSEVPPGLV